MSHLSTMNFEIRNMKNDKDLPQSGIFTLFRTKKVEKLHGVGGVNI